MAADDTPTTVNTLNAERTVLTREELYEMLVDRFGKDPMDWAFVCPSCGDVATGADFKAALKETERGGTASEHLGQICIGRILGALSKGEREYRGRGCDWAAFGLFRGPWEIRVDEDKSMWCFAVAQPEQVRS